ncbi:M56 family metallopeptidase [Aegicerativicinus sediminis]|uniref:M56 family metallopeptidase n=1 Tax=Aegicerativicinus sediminis TaxID=2893202 RepID=UPI001E621C31|nr:M56 family metallopeptidase [Aegicerativicinus sediminis]
MTFLSSLVLPFLRLDIVTLATSENYTIKLPEVYLSEVANNLANNNPVNVVETTSMSFSPLQTIWFLGMLILLIALVFRAFSLYTIYKKSKRIDFDGNIIYLIPGNFSAFSFFNLVFIGDRLENEDVMQIIEHEKVHVKEKHSFDRVLFELAKIPLWFNPLIYFFQRELTLVHEFEADAQVSPNYSNRDYYLNLLSQAFEVPKSLLINSFSNKSILNKRITMLKKHKSSKKVLWNYLVIIPILSAIVLYVSCESYDIQSENDLGQFSYTLEKGGVMSPEIQNIHKKYEAFLLGNPDYVSWAVVDESNKNVSYSIHKATEVVPEGFTKLLVSGNSQSYVMYMNFPHLALSEVQMQKTDQNVEVPYAVIDVPPVYEGCEDILNKDERKKCTSNQIYQFVSTNFNTKIANDLSLEEKRQRINVVFKIGADGVVKDIRSRASVQELEEEAIRVIASLPKFTPGEQRGTKVDVPYSLPIVFEVYE